MKMEGLYDSQGQLLLISNKIESEDMFGEDRQTGNDRGVRSKTVQLPNGRLHILSVFKCIYKG